MKFKFKTILKIVYLISIFIVLVKPVHALNISAIIGDQSTEVLGGDRLYFEVDIKYPENTRRKDLRVEYQVLENGEVIASEKVLRAVETQASFLDYVVIPKSAKGGIHNLNVIVADYGDLHQEVSATFKVVKGIDQVAVYFYVLLGVVVLVGLLVIVQVRFALNSYKKEK